MIEARDLMSVIWWCSFDQQAEEEHNLANRLRRVVTQSLKQFVLCIKHVEHMGGVLYSGVVTSEGRMSIQIDST
jgi:hypothetical protein